MLVVAKANGTYQSKKPKDIRDMNQYEFAEFVAERKRNAKGLSKFGRDIYYYATHPTLHNLFVKILHFLWIFMYVSFQSWLLVLWILYSIVELNQKRFIRNFNWIYFPLICICMFTMYVANVGGVMRNDCFDVGLCRYGLFNFDIPFWHFLMQVSIITYSLASKRVYLKYKENQIEELTLHIKIKKRINSNKLKKVFSRDRIKSFENSDHINLSSITHKKTTAEIILGFVISNWDIGLITALYFAGAYQIDIYHIILMVFFIMFLLYPKFCRKNYVMLIYFIHTIVAIKYMFTLTSQWLDSITIEYLQVIGLATDFNDENKYFRSNLLNNNWFIVLLSLIQYRTYKSQYYQNNLTDKALEANQKEFNRKHPKWTNFFKLCQDIAYVSVPWISFIIYISNAFINIKTLFNFVIYAYSLFLIAIYVLSDIGVWHDFNKKAGSELENELAKKTKKKGSSKTLYTLIF